MSVLFDDEPASMRTLSGWTVRLRQDGVRTNGMEEDEDEDELESEEEEELEDELDDDDGEEEEEEEDEPAEVSADEEGDR